MHQNVQQLIIDEPIRFYDPNDPNYQVVLRRFLKDFARHYWNYYWKVTWTSSFLMTAHIKGALHLHALDNDMDTLFYNEFLTTA